MKKLLSTIITLSILSASAVCVQAADSITVTLDGKEIAFDSAPRIINERVMVPMRKAFEAMDAEIRWDAEASAATAVKEALYAKFTDGAEQMELGVCMDGKNNGEQEYFTQKKLDSAPVIIDGTMYVPMRALAEAFHYSVEWNAERDCVEITTPTDADGWIYYSSWSDGGHMYKADSNGQHRTLLCDSDCYSEGRCFGYGAGYIFFSVRDEERRNRTNKVEGQLYRIKTDGTGKEKLTEQSACLLPEYGSYGNIPTADKNGDLFFMMGESENGGDGYYKNACLYKINAESGEITQLVDEPMNIEECLVYGDYIYFKYDSREPDKKKTYYRVGKDGGDIISVTGNIEAERLRIDTENDRLIFYSYNYDDNKEYNAALDGSDMQEKEIYTGAKYNSDMHYIRAHGDGFIVGKYNYSDDKYCVLDNDGKEIASIPEPEGYKIGEVAVIGDKIYYDVYRQPDTDVYDDKTIYVTSLDELLGMNNISVGAEKVDGKYEIKTRMTTEDYIEILKAWDFDASIHAVNPDGSGDEVILKDYVISFNTVQDDKLVVVNTKEIASYFDNMVNGDYEYKQYAFNPSDGSMEEYARKAVEHPEAAVRGEYREPVLNENAHYGILVRNDGTAEIYSGNGWY